MLHTEKCRRLGRLLRDARPVLGITLVAASAIALAAAGRFDSTPRSAGFLAADRGGQQLIELDRQLGVRRWISAPNPIRLVTRGGDVRPDGAPEAWWIESVGGNPLGPHRLHALDAPLVGDSQAHSEQAVHWTPAGGEWTYLRDLAVDSSGTAFVLSGALSTSQGEVWRVQRGAAPIQIGAFAGASKIQADAGDLWIGAGNGSLWRVSDTGDVIAESTAGAEVHALAVRGGVLWSLDSAGELRRWGPDLQECWRLDLGMTPGVLTVGDDEHAWVTAEGQSFAVRVRPDGRIDVSTHEIGGDAWTSAVSPLGSSPHSGRANSDVLGAAPGYLLMVDATGQALASQGGFHYLSDVATWPLAPGT